MNQSELYQLLRREPQAGMGRILEEYGGLMYAVAMNILKNSQDAEDAVSEALIKIWKNYKCLKKESAFKNYACTVARNCAIDLLRSRQKRMEQSLEQELEAVLPVPDILWQRLDDEMIRQQLQELGEPTCSIFLRRYWCCETVEEIAAALHLTRGAVESRLHRGKKQLKEILMQGGFWHENE